MQVLEELRRDYSATCDAMCDELAATKLFSFERPSGGYFVWARLPVGVRTAALMPVAERLGVVVLPGQVCAPTSAESAAAYEGYVRLCFANVEVPEIKEGVRRLAAAVCEVLARLEKQHLEQHQPAFKK